MTWFCFFILFTVAPVLIEVIFILDYGIEFGIFKFTEVVGVFGFVIIGAFLALIPAILIGCYDITIRRCL